MIDSKNDIYGMIKRLKASRLQEDHAEAIANEISHATYNYHSNEYLDLKFKEFDSRIDSKLQTLKAELLKWFIGVSVIQTVALVISIVSVG